MCWTRPSTTARCPLEGWLSHALLIDARGSRRSTLSHPLRPPPRRRDSECTVPPESDWPVRYQAVSSPCSRWAEQRTACATPSPSSSAPDASSRERTPISRPSSVPSAFRHAKKSRPYRSEAWRVGPCSCRWARRERPPRNPRDRASQRRHPRKHPNDLCQHDLLLAREPRQLDPLEARIRRVGP